jgi:hypothetical protein
VGPTNVQVAAAALFAIAILHTFSGALFDNLARRYPRHEGSLHLLGEVEVVFGFWALVLVLMIFLLAGKNGATDYVDSRNFTEPMFVFAIMVVAGSRPILRLSTHLVFLYRKNHLFCKFSFCKNIIELLKKVQVKEFHMVYV